MSKLLGRNYVLKSKKKKSNDDPKKSTITKPDTTQGPNKCNTKKNKFGFIDDFRIIKAFLATAKR